MGPAQGLEALIGRSFMPALTWAAPMNRDFTKWASYQYRRQRTNSFRIGRNGASRYITFPAQLATFANTDWARSPEK